MSKYNELNSRQNHKSHISMERSMKDANNLIQDGGEGSQNCLLFKVSLF